MRSHAGAWEREIRITVKSYDYELLTKFSISNINISFYIKYISS